MADVNYAIDVKGLTKIYDGKAVVDHINLKVPKGKIYGFLGPNGSGKTTTIRMICGLLIPDDGQGTCLGYDVRSHADLIKRKVGYMTQKFSFWEDLTIRENLKFVADLFHLENAAERVDKTLADLGLSKRGDQLVGALSGGWKQRLALAACILHEPELLLLDEPTAGVDPKARREFWDEIHHLAAAGVTVLVSTHYMDEAERCHAIVYIADGRILARGTVDEVIAQASLTTWRVKGRELMALKEKLLHISAVTTIAAFGDSLHVSGTDAKKLKSALSPFQQDSTYSWELSTPSLEDVFIHYMSKREGH